MKRPFFWRGPLSFSRILLKHVGSLLYGQHTHPSV
jgi:hypothetical protein